MLEPEWTRVRLSLKQKSKIDYYNRPSVDGSVRECACRQYRQRMLRRLFLVWMELGRTAKNFKKKQHVIRRWRLERFDEDEVKVRYQNALKAEVHGFSESVKSKLEGGMKGYDLVNEVLMEWENIVNRVAKSEVGEKMIVCGRAARWWDNEIKEKIIISLRRELYKKVISGREELWDEYCRLRKEVKELVREKKLNIWREVVEKVNTDFDGIRKSSGLL